MKSCCLFFCVVRLNGVDCVVLHNQTIDDMFSVAAANLRVELAPDATMLFLAAPSGVDVVSQC